MSVVVMVVVLVVVVEVIVEVVVVLVDCSKQSLGEQAVRPKP